MITPDEFDTLVRDTLRAVDAQTPQDTTAAARLIANAREGSLKVVPLRRRPPWIAPLIAAAVVVAVALGVVLVKDRGNGRPVQPATQLPSTSAPTTSAPTTTRSTSPAPSSPAPSSAPTTAAPSPTVAGFKASDVSYLNARNGWAMGDGKCATGPRSNCATLLRTVDGGRTWHEIDHPAGLVSTRDEGSCGDNGTPLGPCADQVVFATAKIGYLWSYRAFYLTTDGGKHWTDLKTPLVHEVIIVGQAAVRLTTRAGCSAGCSFGVFAAPIGTTNWTKVIPYSHGEALPWELAGGSGVGYVLEQFPSQMITPKSQALYRSTDGTHWTRVTAAWPCGTHGIDTIRVGFDGSLSATCY